MVSFHGKADTTVSSEESIHFYNAIVDKFGTSKATLELKNGLKHMDSGFYTSENLTTVVSSIKSYFEN